MKRARLDWFVLVTSAVIALSGCGGGCGGCTTFEPIPGGFPVAKRMPNAVQVRLSQSGLAAISANPAALIGSIAGGMNGVVQFPVPASCGGSTPICCPGGTAQPNCGPIDIDLTEHPGDLPRLELHPQQGASTLNVTARMRIKTETDIPVTVPVIGDCGVHVDTTQGATPDVQIDVPIAFQQDAMAGTTNVVVGAVNLTNLESSDVSLTGGFGCSLADLGISFFLNTLTSALTSQVQSAIQSQTCKSCSSGNVADCGSPFATACTNGTCMEGSACMQELGLDGRMPASALFGSFSPGTTGALDLYEVAGGYSTTDNNGVALGLLGGMEPGGSDRDRCGPTAMEPAAPTIPQSAFFQGNTRPDTGDPFDVAIGVHASQLAQFAFAGYQGGLLCLTIGHNTVAQLSTDTIGVLSRSLGNLVDGNVPVAVGLRPQSPPTITLGTNTFDQSGALVDPLLDIKFQQLEIDFFAAVDDQYIRIMTVVADVHLPVGLQVGGMGQLTPVLGNPMDAFTNLSVKNSEALTESPADLAAVFPSVLGLVLPQLSGGLPAISLPQLGGLSLNVTGITSVDNASFMAIFANLVTTSPREPVHTTVALTSIAEPPANVVSSPRLWAGARPPAVTLALGGDAPDLEWSYRLDGGSWSGWSRDAHPTIAPATFWLKGMHHVSVRARRIGHPETIDTAPPTVELPIGVPATAASSPLPFHGTGTGAGCTCDARGGDPGGAGLFALVLLLIIVPRARRGFAAPRSIAKRSGGIPGGVRRGLRGLRRLGAVTWLAALACLPGCSCGGHPCGDSACMTGDVAHAAGRWTSIAADDQRVMVATYDPQNGDLVAADATDPSKLAYTAVDGIPDGTPTYDPGTYRGGITDPGPDVGAWTSIALANHTARIAYQDRDAKALKYAYEDGKSWSSFVVDPGMGEEVGQYASLVIDASGHPAIAYLAIGVDDGMGHRNTELRLARATTGDPKAPGDFTSSVIASAPGTCGGLCGAGEACVASATAGAPETCVTPTTDCASACSMSQTCSAGACLTTVPKPTVEDIPTGTGLWVRLVVLQDGRLAAVYYDRTRLALVIAVENGPNTSQFTETVLDGNATGMDRGMWPSAVVASDGTVDIAYQDALADELWFTTWNGSAGTPQLVDDGTRMGETRTHNVGASAAIFLANGTPAIAYQDGLTSDVDLAMQSGSNWSASGLATGPLLDGFSIGATAGHGSPVLAWGEIDPSQTPVWHLTVQAP